MRIPFFSFFGKVKTTRIFIVYLIYANWSKLTTRWRQTCLP